MAMATEAMANRPEAATVEVARVMAVVEMVEKAAVMVSRHTATRSRSCKLASSRHSSRLGRSV